MPERTETTRPIFSIVALFLLALMFVLAGGAALHESVTFDEIAHIGAGVSYLQKLDLRFNAEHPPLAKIIAALPLVIHGVHADYSGNIWEFSQDFFPAFLGEWIFGEHLLTKWNDPQTVLMWSRLSMLLLTIATGWVVFVFARRLGGDWGGLLCVAVYAATPAFIVFGPLVLTDIPITFFTLLALWAIANLWDNPDRRNALIAGVAIGGAFLTKFTAPILAFAFLAISLSTRWRALAGQPVEKSEARAWRRLRWRAMWRAVAWTAAVVYVVYFVFSWNQPISIPGLAGHGMVASFFGRLLMPPWILLRGMFLVVVSGNRPTYLLGHPYPHGVWFFFPALFVMKSPLGFLALLALAVALAFAAKRMNLPPVIPANLATHWRVLWVSLVIFVAICVLSHFNVSIRHFTIPLVLLILLLAPLPRMVEQFLKLAPKAAWTCAATVVVLAASCLITAVRTYPYYFPYTNPLFSGKPGYVLMSDSNLDWNQSLPEVQAFAQQHSLTDVPIDIYAMFESTAWVPKSRTWDCQAPTDADAGKWVVVSGNMILDGHNCGWLLQYPRQSLAEGSMYAIQLPSPIPPPGSPGGPPPPEARRILFGMPFDMRSVFQRIDRHPEDIPVIVKQMQDDFQKQMQARNK